MTQAPRSRARAPLAAGIAALAVVLAGCAGPPAKPLPAEIVSPPAGDLQLVEARQSPERHQGAAVRWGGTVVATSEEPDGSVRIEVLERRLDDRGRPLPGSPSDGRFAIRAAADEDPERYRRGNEITVSGTVEGSVASRIGNEQQRLPLVRVQTYVLWPRRWYPPYDYDPWYYGPRWHLGIGVGHLHRHYRPLHHHRRHHY